MVAARAVDGNRDSISVDFCARTNMESDPWWRVDLQNTYKISAVIITNRNRFENRLDGAEIWIGSSTETNDDKKIRCAVISHIPSGGTFYFPCRAAEGRYVTVLLRGSNKVLTFCEVEVYYGNANVALKGDAAQSSTLSFATASKAIDGRRNSFFCRGSCSHTAENETNPWWRVDLRGIYMVMSVKVTNRGDCCAERLDGAEIRIGNSQENNGNNNPRCASISQIRAGKTYTYQCDGVDGGSMLGRFVNIIIPGERKTLTLCEVEVYATPAVEPLPNVALWKQAEQSSTELNGLASYAVSGCRSGSLYGCCTHTSVQSNPWWRVDLLAVHKVSVVSIINRQDCCSERLLGAQILIGNSPEINDKNLRCGTISSVQSTPTHTFQCGDMEGRYVIVVIPGEEKILTLCEVEVYASLAARSSSSPPPPTPPPPPTESMQLSGRTVTLVGDRLCWSDALFYCRLHHWDLLSLRSEEEQSAVEQLLSRGPFPLTDYVWLGLRRYIMRNTWFWMSGDSVKFTKWSQTSSPFAYSYSHYPCGGMAKGERHLWEDQPCEELLNFICESRAADGAQRVSFASTRNVLSGG
ncbi:uncharacterized protein LOC118338482 [Morone saxatilis]|uniref:uncharacterized protein LOC118338482 n=1 Tax=Morone saxatilis TaxID=34816 RepID=UPI0015E1C3E7|nr:uncharacterized protein LOC118338482 [Morone saxatilis]